MLLPSLARTSRNIRIAIFLKILVPYSPYRFEIFVFLFHLSLILYYLILFHILGWGDELNFLKCDKVSQRCLPYSNSIPPSFVTKFTFELWQKVWPSWRRNVCLVANIFEGPTPSFEAMAPRVPNESKHQNLLAQQERRFQGA
jgi:hypothetical protein